MIKLLFSVFISLSTDSIKIITYTLSRFHGLGKAITFEKPFCPLALNCCFYIDELRIALGSLKLDVRGYVNSF